MVDMLGHLPKLGIEVGSFIGSSAVFLGDFMRISGGVLVCVDTWCGDINMWLLDSFQDTMAKYDGDPKIYELFMQNIIDNKLQGTVIPLRLTSIIAARMLRILNYEIDFVYVDSAHEAGETFMELMLYHDILKDGGVLFGDDYEGFPAVKYDVDLFCKRFGYVLEFTGDGDTWMIKKC
jgi:predicted O-methyltransferase YrrM